MTNVVIVVLYFFLPAFMLAAQWASCPLRPPCLATLRSVLTDALVGTPCRIENNMSSDSGDN